MRLPLIVVFVIWIGLFVKSFGAPIVPSAEPHFAHPSRAVRIVNPPYEKDVECTERLVLHIVGRLRSWPCRWTGKLRIPSWHDRHILGRTSRSSFRGRYREQLVANKNLGINAFQDCIGASRVEYKESPRHGLDMSCVISGYEPHPQSWAVEGNEGLFSRVGRISGGISGSFGLGETSLYGTVHRFQGLLMALHRAPLEIGEECDGSRSFGRQYCAQPRPPIGRRVIVLWGSSLLLFPGCYFGSKFVDSGRNRVGIATIVGSFILFALGLALIVLSVFGWSWGWWL